MPTNEEATITEFVLAASKIKHEAHPIQFPLLHFRDEQVDCAYESRQIGTSFTVVSIVACMVSVVSSVRLIRVALGVETASGASGVLQVGLFAVCLLVHVCIGGCASYIRNRNRLSHIRPIRAMATASAITLAFITHMVTRDIFCSSDQPALLAVWLIVIPQAFASPSLTSQASVPMCVQPLIGFVILQPILVSPHLELSVRVLLAFMLAGVIACNYQTEKQKRRAFINELELISQCQKSSAISALAEQKLANTKAENIRLEEKIQATELLSSMSTKLTRSEIQRAKVEVWCSTSGGLNLWELSNPLEVNARHTNNAFKVTPVQRNAKVAEAWSVKDGVARWAHSIGNQQGQAAVKMPCLAVKSCDGNKFTARCLTKEGLIQERQIKPGSHPFVVVEGEPYIRIGSMARKFGAANGHPWLASEANVLYAGEIEFDSEQATTTTHTHASSTLHELVHCLQVLTRWSNMSGTYRCSDDMAFQAGLALDKFYSVYTGEIPQEMDSEERLRFVQAEGSDVWLMKVLSFTESEMIVIHNRWVGYLHALLEENADAKECHGAIKRMSAQMCDAIDQYGLYNYV